MIPRSRTASERVLKAINRPDREHVQALIFSWQDVREGRAEGSRAYALLNDEERPPAPALIEALGAYDIRPVGWSARAAVVDELAA